jgi:hypothetical protein
MVYPFFLQGSCISNATALGSPWTVGESQAHLSKGPLGEHITFIQDDPRMVLARCLDNPYDYAVLNNCLWYFDSPMRICRLVSLLANRAHCKKVLVAEWSLKASCMEQVPHVLAAMVRGAREALDEQSDENIRTPVSPAWITTLFEKYKCPLEREEWVETPAEMMDGQREVGSVLSTNAFAKSVMKVCGLPKELGDSPAAEAAERQAASIMAGRDALRFAVEQLEGGLKGVRCMQIWAAVF